MRRPFKPFEPTKPLSTAAAAIVREVFERYAPNMDRRVLFTASQTWPGVGIRMTVFRRIHAELGWSYCRIGAVFNFDHSTVRHACLKDQAAIDRMLKAPVPARQRIGYVPRGPSLKPETPRMALNWANDRAVGNPSGIAHRMLEEC